MNDAANLNDVNDEVDNGVRTVTLTSPSSWDRFQEITRRLKGDHLWRGQRQDKPLISSFDRHFRLTDPTCRHVLLVTVLKRFVEEMKRCHPGVLEGRGDLEIWALGQHHGLRTPLLDWTVSPNIAAYFALERPKAEGADDYRYVYGLKKSIGRVLRKSNVHGEAVVERFVRLVEQVRILGSRIQAQKGVFTKALNGEDIETNVQRYCKLRPHDVPLVKFRIPTDARDMWLSRLNTGRSPINGVTLQLDLRDVMERCR